jgi:hypothetical protein
MFERSSLPYVINLKIELQISVADLDPDLLPDSDPEISPPDPNPDPALVVFKKILFLCNIVHMYIYLLCICDSSIGIGKVNTASRILTFR